MTGWPARRAVRWEPIVPTAAKRYLHDWDALPVVLFSRQTVGVSTSSSYYHLDAFTLPIASLSGGDPPPA